MDVTELHRERAAAEQARRDAEAARLQLSEGIEALPDGFALFDANDRLVVCNARYRELYSASASVLQPGVRFEDVLRYGLSQGQYPQATGREQAWLQERLRDHRQPQGPVIQELPGNRWLRIDERATASGGIAGVRTEVTELVRHQQQLTRLNLRLSEANARVELLSETDAVTGIANRRRFDRRLAEEWDRVARDGVTLGLLLVDIDDFKAFNDRHGHQAGDACLKHVAAVLAACASRPTDVVARYGGEEFAILLPHTGGSDLMHLAQRCVAAVDAAAIEHGASRAAPHLTISVGAAFADAAANANAARLLRAADAALYRAKAAGRRRAEMADGAI